MTKLIRYPVTPTHRSKYAVMARELGVRFHDKSYSQFGFKTLDELLKLQSADPALQQMPSSAFDAWIEGVRRFNKPAQRLGKVTLICLAKHCLLEHTLGARPSYITNAEFKL